MSTENRVSILVQTSGKGNLKCPLFFRILGILYIYIYIYIYIYLPKIVDRSFVLVVDN